MGEQAPVLPGRRCKLSSQMAGDGPPLEDAGELLISHLVEGGRTCEQQLPGAVITGLLLEF